MKRKFLLFNYFLQKAVQKEQELLRIDDFRAALLALIVSRASVFHRCASGCSTQKAYLCKPKYAEELFLYLCLDAEKHGDALLKEFKFQKTHSFSHATQNMGDFEDVELTGYLDQIYPLSKFFNKEDKELYAAILENPADIAELEAAHTFLRKVAVDSLELPAQNEKTAMIDRAWERVWEVDEFPAMFTLTGKHDVHGRSYPYNRYMDNQDILQSRS